jgi:hypothetical protein
LVNLSNKTIIPVVLNHDIYESFCNFKLLFGNLPSSIEYLKIFEKDYIGTKNIILKSILSDIYQIKKDIYENVIELKFNNCIDLPIDNLPLSITHLVLGDNFDQPIDNLPSSIMHLGF